MAEALRTPPGATLAGQNPPARLIEREVPAAPDLEIHASTQLLHPPRDPGPRGSIAEIGAIAAATGCEIFVHAELKRGRKAVTEGSLFVRSI